MAINHVAFVMYPVTDMPRALAFYRDGLGFTPGDLQSDFWNEFEIGGTTFGIGSFEQVGKAGTAQSLAIEVDDIVAFRAELGTRGIVAGEAHELDNCFIGVVDDPDGNKIWLHQRKT